MPLKHATAGIGSIVGQALPQGVESFVTRAALLSCTTFAPRGTGVWYYGVNQTLVDTSRMLYMQ